MVSTLESCCTSQVLHSWKMTDRLHRPGQHLIQSAHSWYILKAPDCLIEADVSAENQKEVKVSEETTLVFGWLKATSDAFKATKKVQATSYGMPDKKSP